MTEERRENVFTAQDRVWLKEVRAQVRGINGSVKRHEEEIFGSEKNHTTGLKETMDQMVEFKTQIKAGIAVVVVLLTIIGVSNLILLFRTPM